MQQWSQGCGWKLDLPLYVGSWGAPSCSAGPSVGQAGTCGLFPFISPLPFLALNFVTCREAVQNNVAHLATVKSSMQVGGQGKLHKQHLITTDTLTAVQVRKQFVWGGMDQMRYSALCLDYFMSNKVWALIFLLLLGCLWSPSGFPATPF